MITNPNPNELIEIEPNRFVRIKHIWLVPRMLFKTELIGFGFKDDETLQDYKDGIGNQSVLIDFGIVPTKLTDNIVDAIHARAIERFTNWTIVLDNGTTPT